MIVQYFDCVSHNFKNLTPKVKVCLVIFQDKTRKPHTAKYFHQKQAHGLIPTPVAKFQNIAYLRRCAPLPAQTHQPYKLRKSGARSFHACRPQMT